MLSLPLAKINQFTENNWRPLVITIKLFGTTNTFQEAKIQWNISSIVMNTKSGSSRRRKINDFYSRNNIKQ